MGKLKRRPVRIGHLTQAKFLRLLMNGELSIHEIADEIGMHRVTAYRYCNALHREGVIHIAGYQIDSIGRDGSRIFKLGAGKDVKRYALSRTEQYRRKNIADAGRRLQKRLTQIVTP